MAISRKRTAAGDSPHSDVVFPTATPMFPDLYVKRRVETEGVSDYVYRHSQDDAEGIYMAFLKNTTVICASYGPLVAIAMAVLPGRLYAEALPTVSRRNPPTLCFRNA